VSARPIDPDRGLQRVALERFGPAGHAPGHDLVIEEQAIALSYNGFTHAVMMATPTDLEDYARGFSLTEGIVERGDSWRLLAVERHALGVVLEMGIAPARFDVLRERRRSLVGSSACGLCGSESLAQVARPVRQVARECHTDVATIAAAMAALVEHQQMNRASGGVHAAGYFADGQILVREDVGRHNALDKLVGALQSSEPMADGVLVLTSRASYELLHKAAMVDLAIVATVSAPTTAAIALAEAAGITLLGFARGMQMNVYTHARRVAAAGATGADARA
jgi:formate dehydrogenase accessory protein FdhD